MSSSFSRDLSLREMFIITKRLRDATLELRMEMANAAGCCGLLSKRAEC